MIYIAISSVEEVEGKIEQKLAFQIKLLRGTQGGFWKSVAHQIQ